MINQNRRKARCRFKILTTTKRPYVLSVYKTNKYMYAQLDSLENRNTVVTMCSKAVGDNKSLNKVVARNFGIKFVEKIKEKFSAALPEVAFDRSGYNYHGRILEFAEGAREAGLKF